MNARDLRIGNLLYKQGKACRVIEIGVKHKDDNDYYLRIEGDSYGYWMDQFEPIPITEEVLLDCGFKPIENKNYPEIINHTKEYGDYTYVINIRCTEPKISFWVHDHPLAYFDYLHQLQNIYFALTGQELPINIKRNQY